MVSKKGIIIKIERDNITSHADLSPLEHISTESYEDIHNDCKNIDTNKIFNDIDDHLKSNLTQFKSEKFLDFDFSIYTKHPSFQHALSCLFSDFYRQKLKVKLLGKVFYQGLIADDKTDDVSKKAAFLENTGFQRIKVKIGSTPKNLESENQFLKKIIASTNRIKLRLDANQKFDLADYSQILKNIDLSRIEFVEEPVFKKIELLKFSNTTKIPIAIDENIKLLKDIRIDGIKALIIKPTLLGDYHTIKKTIQSYEEKGVSILISSSYESQVGIYQLAQLAYALSPHEFHGLDTFDCFLENLLDLDIENNAISLKENLELKGPIYV